MADFLSNLLDRTFQPEAVLQRRRPSFFEPMVQSGPDTVESAPDEHVEIDATPRIRRERRNDHDRQIAAGSHRRRAAPSATIAGELPDIANEASDGSEPNHLQRKAGRLPRNADELPLHGARDMQPSAGASIEPGAPAETLVRTEVTRVVERIIERTQPPLLNTVLPLTPQDSEHTRPVTPVDASTVPVVVQRNRSPLEADTLRPTARLRPDVPLPLITGPRPTQRVPRAAASPPPQAPPLPTIQVTIGRVEIRATPQTAASRSARPTTPRLSLEEYLRSRSGGSR